MEGVWRVCGGCVGGVWRECVLESKGVGFLPPPLRERMLKREGATHATLTLHALRLLISILIPIKLDWCSKTFALEMAPPAPNLALTGVCVPSSLDSGKVGCWR